MEQTEKKCFVHIENYTGDHPIEIIYREDSPAKVLDPIPVKMPEAINVSGTIDAPLEYLSKRLGSINIDNSRVEVFREEAKITLVINERNCHDGYSAGSVESIINQDICEFFTPRSTVTGTISYTDEFKKLGINADAFWSPVKLAKYLRLNRHLFADVEEGMALISILKNIKATITGQYNKQKENHGSISISEFFEQNISHNLPSSFTLNLSIFKGGAREKYAVEIDAELVDGEIRVQLVSPAMNEANESVRDSLLDETIDKIRAIAPSMVIINK